MEADSLKRDSNYWHLADKFRGSIEFTNQLNLFALVAIAAKIDPKGFVELYEAPKGKHGQILETIIEHQLLSLVGISSIRGVLETAPEELLQELIYFVESQPDFEKLADLIAHLYLGQRGKLIREASTTNSIARLFCSLVGDASNNRIYDGAAGICTTTAMINPKSVQLEDINEEVCFLGASILLLKEIKNDYACNDSLTYLQPKAQADLVVSQPPFGLRLSTENLSKIEKSKMLQFDQSERLPRSSADALWIQQALYHTKETGKAFILLPQGWMFRGGYDAKLREFLIDNDLVQTIITLPSGLLGFTNIPSVMLILNKSKSENQKNRVCFIDASQIIKLYLSDNSLNDDEINEIVQLTNNVGKNSSVSTRVKLPEIYQNSCNLSIGLYIQQEVVEEFEDLEEETRKLEDSFRSFDSAKKSFEKAMDIDLSNINRDK